jgi:hypothetical protein
MNSTAYPLRNSWPWHRIALRPLWLHHVAKVIGYRCWLGKRTTAKLMRWYLSVALIDYVTGQSRADEQWRQIFKWPHPPGIWSRVKTARRESECKAFVKKISDESFRAGAGSRGVGSCVRDDDSHNRAPLLTPPFYFSPNPRFRYPANEANKKETYD